MTETAEVAGRGRGPGVARRLARAGTCAVLVATSACGLGDEAARADVIIDAMAAVADAGTAHGTLHVATRVVELPPSVVALGGGDGSPGGVQAAVDVDVPAAELEVQVDFGDRRASLTAPRSDEPFQLFDGLVVFGRRRAASERDARPWMRVDTEDLDDGGGRLDVRQDHPSLAALAISPLLLVDLMAGPLSGSVDPAATEEVDGAATRRYDANFDIEKTLRRTRRSSYPETSRRAVEDLFDTLRVSGITHPGQVWVDGNGMPRRMVLRLRLRPQRGLEVDLVLRLDLRDIGAPVSLTMPSVDERLEVASVVQLLRAGMPVDGAPELPAPDADASLPALDPPAEPAEDEAVES